MFFLPDTKGVIEVTSKHDPKGEVIFVLGAPDPLEYSRYISKKPDDDADIYDSSRHVLSLCLRDIRPMPKGWKGRTPEGRFPIEQIRRMDLNVIGELSNIAIENFISPNKDLEKNS